MRESAQEMGGRDGGRLLREQVTTDILLRGVEPSEFDP